MRSRRIHIGMDEAHRLGLGSYLARHGYRGRFQVMNEHLSRVLEISRRHDLRPMIWSDMYFDLNVQDRAVAKHYAALAADLRAAAGAARGWHDLLEVYGRLATVLSLKGCIPFL